MHEQHLASKAWADAELLGPSISVQAGIGETSDLTGEFEAPQLAARPEAFGGGSLPSALEDSVSKRNPSRRQAPAPKPVAQKIVDNFLASTGATSSKRQAPKTPVLSSQSVPGTPSSRWGAGVLGPGAAPCTPPFVEAEGAPSSDAGDDNDLVIDVGFVQIGGSEKYRLSSYKKQLKQPDVDSKLTPEQKASKTLAVKNGLAAESLHEIAYTASMRATHYKMMCKDIFFLSKQALPITVEIWRRLSVAQAIFELDLGNVEAFVGRLQPWRPDDFDDNVKDLDMDSRVEDTFLVLHVPPLSEFERAEQMTIEPRPEARA